MSATVWRETAGAPRHAAPAASPPDPEPAAMGAAVARWCAAGITLLIAVAAFALSFAALRDLARAAGTPPGLVWLWPVVVDGTIAQATIAVVALSRTGTRGAKVFFWLVLLAAAAVSVAGNALHAMRAVAGSAAMLTPGQAAAVSIVAPIALLAATHGVAVLLRAGQNRAPVTQVSQPVTHAVGQPVHEPAPAVQGGAPAAVTLTRVDPPGALVTHRESLHESLTQSVTRHESHRESLTESVTHGVNHAGHDPVQRDSGPSTGPQLPVHELVAVAQRVAEETGRDVELVHEILTLRHAEQLAHRRIAERVTGASPSTVTRVLADARRVSEAGS